MSQRGSGILLHISSLPSRYGIGDLGPWAHRFADFLAESRQRYWQILPLNPTSTDCGNCPYSSCSAFAGNPLLISPDLLLREGMLQQKDLEEMPPFPDDRVDYQLVSRHKSRLLDKVYRRHRSRLSAHNDFGSFCSENSGWLEDESLFSALRGRLGRRTWRDWPKELRNRETAAVRQWKIKCQEEMRREQFFQYLFFKQWAALKRYCNDKNVLLIGDLPIYVDYNSADVWANPEIFKLDDEKRPTVVAGVPPDYFSTTGQLWGNPVYRWDVLQATQYTWWVKRLQHNMRFFDRIRLDHFRGLIACWEIPAGKTTAIHGQWVKTASADFFATMVKQLPPSSLLAEDLGVITPDVREAMERFGLPGMKVLLFAFGEEPANHPYAPHNYGEHCVVYTGTHDTNTVKGWFEREARPEDRERLFAYLGRRVTAEEVSREMIRLALKSAADTAIVPMQDLLSLGAEARMNRPATTEGNWDWRFTPGQITPALIGELAEITELSSRVPA